MILRHRDSLVHSATKAGSPGYSMSYVSEPVVSESESSFDCSCEHSKVAEALKKYISVSEPQGGRRGIRKGGRRRAGMLNQLRQQN